MSDDRIGMSLPIDQPTAPESDDSDIGIRRQFKAMRARVQELEVLYASRFRNQVATSTTLGDGKHRLSCGFHPHVWVDERAPVVKCSVCDETLDPIGVLRQFAHRERQFAHQLEHLREEKQKLESEVEQLKRQRSNLRTSVKRAEKP